MADLENAGVEDAWTPVPGAAVGWLNDLDPDHCYSGFEPPRRPDGVWVLHSMYAWKEGLVTTTHDDVHQSVRAAGLTEPDVMGDADLGDLLEGAVVTGTGLGRSGDPGAGWRRLRWAELARGFGEEPVPDGELPGNRCLRQAHPTGSWSAAIRPPAEGCLDRESWRRLVDVLARHSPAGAETACLAYYCPLVTADWDDETVLAGRLGDAAGLYDHPEMSSCPSNLWAEDRSWVVYCDWDLWGTKVVGPVPLVEALLEDSGLEALRLPWTG
ncbi:MULTISPECIES: hypothetical protein [Thermomonosporaceae]|uniref:hypothetical protein n=1 Tax=Thermomonosporaceae TaxID=2012 RepID=UPI00255AB732|nr:MULTISPECIES: hypothetical protein [Thermomonosporaceae]MDL4771178.1 hypothetical protein [Actinomadura xylanilytica]